MRLLDQVAQAREPTVIIGRAGKQVFPSSAARAAAVAACPMRFVLEADAAARCREVADSLRSAVDWNAMLRMPATEFWAEWMEEDGRRTGVFVQTGAGEYAAVVETFWEQTAGEPDRAQAIVRLDLAEPIAAEIDEDGCVALRPGAHPLARHLAFDIDAQWLGHFLQEGEEAALHGVRLIVSNLVPAIEMLIAFATLLSIRPVLATREVDQSRLNRVRARKGRQALLDHIEVRLDLARSAALHGEGGTAAAREPVRCHPVRGHLVHRGGGIFWRRPHLRGDPSRRIASRTTYITAGLRE